MPPIAKPKRRQDEAQLGADIKLFINQQPDFMIWRNAIVPAGIYRRVDPRTGELGPPVFLRAGEPGSPDYMGIQAMPVVYQGRSMLVGRFFAPEIKVDKEVPRENQEEWADRGRLYGACIPVLRSLADTEAALDRARKGENR